MLGLLILPTLLGLGFAIDYVSGENEDENPPEDPPVETTLSDNIFIFEGTEAKDHVTGNDQGNVFIGDAGEDLFGGGDGDDALFGGEDDDRLFGSAGDDLAIGGAGDDRIFLGDGDDSTLPLDNSFGDEGDDFIRGGAGADTLFDTQGSNQIYGDLGHDRILTVDGLTPDGTVDPDTSEPTVDTVDAGFGNDTLIGDNGDILTGGAGIDTFVVATAIESEGTPVVLTDFDVRDDLFSLVFMEQPPEDPTVTLSFDSDTNEIRASVEGKEVATLHGLAAEDIPFIRTYVTTLPELLAGT